MSTLMIFAVLLVLTIVGTAGLIYTAEDQTPARARQGGQAQGRRQNA